MKSWSTAWRYAPRAKSTLIEREITCGFGSCSRTEICSTPLEDQRIINKRLGHLQKNFLSGQKIVYRASLMRTVRTDCSCHSLFVRTRFEPQKGELEEAARRLEGEVLNSVRRMPKWKKGVAHYGIPLICHAISHLKSNLADHPSTNKFYLLYYMRS